MRLQLGVEWICADNQGGKYTGWHHVDVSVQARVKRHDEVRRGEAQFVAELRRRSDRAGRFALAELLRQRCGGEAMRRARRAIWAGQKSAATAARRLEIAAEFLAPGKPANELTTSDVAEFIVQLPGKRKSKAATADWAGPAPASPPMGSGQGGDGPCK